MATTVRRKAILSNSLSLIPIRPAVGDETISADKAKYIFGTNYGRLQKVKAKYDPDVVFSKWFAIIPSTA